MYLSINGNDWKQILDIAEYYWMFIYVPTYVFACNKPLIPDTYCDITNYNYISVRFVGTDMLVLYK